MKRILLALITFCLFCSVYAFGMFENTSLSSINNYHNIKQQEHSFGGVTNSQDNQNIETDNQVLDSRPDSTFSIEIHPISDYSWLNTYIITCEIINLNTMESDTLEFVDYENEYIELPEGDYGFYYYIKKNGWSCEISDICNVSNLQPPVYSINEASSSEVIDIRLINYLNDGIDTFENETGEAFTLGELSVTPLWIKSPITLFVRQLLYVNNLNQIMIAGYQTRRVNGWETFTLPEPLLYFENNLELGESFTGHMAVSDGSGIVMTTFESTFTEVYNRWTTQEELQIKSITTIYETNDNVIHSSEIGYTGGSLPYSISWFMGNDTHQYHQNREISTQGNNTILWDLTPNETVSFRVCSTERFITNMRIDQNNMLRWNTVVGVRNDTEVDYYKIDVYDVNWDLIATYNTADNSRFYPLEDNVVEDYYRISNHAFYLDGSSSNYGHITDQIVPNIDDSIEPVSLNVNNYPNPFNPETTILFSLVKPTMTKVEIFNIKGQKVKTLLDDKLDSGEHKIVWNGKDDNGKSLASGVFFYKMTSGNYSSTKKMVLMK